MIFLLPVVRMPEQGSNGDMQTLLWTLRPHRLPFFCTAVCSGAFTSLLPQQQWRPMKQTSDRSDNNCQRDVGGKITTQKQKILHTEVGKRDDRDKRKYALIIDLNQKRRLG